MLERAHKGTNGKEMPFFGNKVSFRLWNFKLEVQKQNKCRDKSALVTVANVSIWDHSAGITF